MTDAQDTAKTKPYKFGEEEEAEEDPFVNIVTRTNRPVNHKSSTPRQQDKSSTTRTEATQTKM
jgi:hypothetical protein